jgi:hypothetical protein
MAGKLNFNYKVKFVQVSDLLRFIVKQGGVTYGIQNHVATVADANYEQGSESINTTDGFVSTDPYDITLEIDRQGVFVDHTSTPPKYAPELDKATAIAFDGYKLGVK